MSGSLTQCVRKERKKLGLALWGTEPMQLLVRHVQLAEQLGFDSVWVIDSQLICREVYCTLAACVAGTSRIRLATGVTQPRTRHPSVTASALATLNEMSGGRMILGMGTGFSSLTTLGMKAAKMAEFEQYLATVRSLLHNESARFEGGVEGKITWLDGPVRIPIFAAASGPRMTRLAGRIADGVILLQGIAPDLVARGLSWIAEGAQEVNRSPDAVSVACWVPLGLASDGASARNQVRSRVAGAIWQTNPDWFKGNEREAVLRVKQSYEHLEHAASNADHASIVPDGLIDKYAIAGSPGEVRDKVLQLAAQPGIDRIILTPQVPGEASMPVDDILRSFEKHVLGHL